ncbi:winged helix-turn-helix domain-containing protein [Pelagibacterium halotolerans]|uniref:winged helix-turn-helix domain-containing protein n=1 Tax=Pelagibacterium halotolerans TaxID=531813 RepID=UPI00385173F1
MGRAFSHLRRLALSRQGLASQRRFGVGLAGTKKAIEHLGYVQIDTLAVVERAHHHVLWNRVPGYDTAHLNRLTAEKCIFEYWFHAASYLPMRDYRFALPRMASIRNGESRYLNDVDTGLMDEILARVRSEGALRVRDIDTGTKSQNGSWWNWGPGRRALDKLFMQGDLMVCERNGMEKVYDLAERCLPEGIDLSMPTMEEYAAYLFDTTRRAHGVFTLKQLLHLRPGRPIRDAMRAIVDDRIAAGVVKPLDPVGGSPAYVDVEALENVSRMRKRVQIVSPFDNVLIHRDRLSALFGFEYRLECYVPAPKRVFGYFCLPILFGNAFVGRIDCKARRAERRFEVLSLHLEDRSLDMDRFLPAFTAELQRFAEFNACPQLDLAAIQGRLFH